LITPAAIKPPPIIEAIATEVDAKTIVATEPAKINDKFMMSSYRQKNAGDTVTLQRINVSPAKLGVSLSNDDG